MKETKVLVVYNPSIIHLTGDKEYEAVANYLWNRHHTMISDIETARAFAINFMIKYNADAVLHIYQGKRFYYPVFHKR